MSSREVKQVSFGKKDEKLLEFLEDKGAFSKYVKKLIMAEIERVEEAKQPKLVQVAPTMEEKVDEILELLKSGKLQLSDSKDTTDTKEEHNELTLSEGQKTAIARSLKTFGVVKK